MGLISGKYAGIFTVFTVDEKQGSALKSLKFVKSSYEVLSELVFVQNFCNLFGTGKDW